VHIPDGFLSGYQGYRVAAGAYLLSGAAVGWSLKKLGRRMDDRIVPVVGMMSAFIFAAQMLNFPVPAGTSGHFLGAAIATVVLGPLAGMLSMTLVLVLQCLLFADGGIIALGANVLNMAVIGCLITWAIFAVLRPVVTHRRRALIACGAAAGFLSVVLASAACSVELALSGNAALKPTLTAMVSVHAFIGAAEAGITAAILGMLLATRPDLISVWPQKSVAEIGTETEALA
jgi:cobalt/nickel transport system permease protein